MAITEATDLEAHGIRPRGQVFWNPTVAQCYEHTLVQGAERLAEGGPLVVDTQPHTGRSPNDRYVVREPASEEMYEELRVRALTGLGAEEAEVAPARAPRSAATRPSG